MSQVEDLINQVTVAQCSLRILYNKIKHFQNNQIACCSMWKLRSYMIAQIPIYCQKDRDVVKPFYEDLLDPFKALNILGNDFNCTGYEDESEGCTKFWALLVTAIVSAIIIVTLAILYCVVTTCCCIGMLCCNRCRKTEVINIGASVLYKTKKTKKTESTDKSINSITEKTKTKTQPLRMDTKIIKQLKNTINSIKKKIKSQKIFKDRKLFSTDSVSYSLDETPKIVPKSELKTCITNKNDGRRPPLTKYTMLKYDD
ncbi:hypothetical protein DERP_001065 [Dermatophagoides pteronyssinus]|uniref:Uncharacterized protein n=1 Tax=Dermatophagoides pteronyssinus TaxID=6956 RepID=A0ABQ8JDE3_DERPT|nr:hypothetical protein DERP_001065 [Dermatophagoides pteronyssinus]